MNMNSVINNVINYMLFGIWSFCQVLEYKYYTRVEQYESIVENTKACKRQYHELLVKMAQLEARIEELSSSELSELSESSLEDKEIEDKELEDKELEDMANEDLHASVVTSVDSDLESESVPSVDSDLESESVPSVESYLATELETELETLVDTELVDISEETYPVKQQKHNKKSWLKTILFM